MHSPLQMGYVARVAWWCRGFPHLRSGASLRSGEGGAHAVEEGMMDGEEVGGRV